MSHPLFDLSGRVALVSGAAQGIGRAISLALAEVGADLMLADLNEEGANLLALQTRQQLGIQSLAFAGQSEQSILGLFR